MGNFFDVVNKVTSLYVTYRGRYVLAMNGRIFIPKKDGLPKRLDNLTIINHVNQRYAIGVFSAEHGSKFICFDVDMPDEDIVRQVTKGLCDFGIPHDMIHISYSGGKGFHVEVFFTDLVYLDDLRNLYLWVIKHEGLDPHKVEFRPTFGQAIKVPLSIHHKTGNVCWYLDRDTLQPIKTPEYVLTITQMDRDTVEKMIHEKIVPSELVDEKKQVFCVPLSNGGQDEPLGDEYMNMTRPHTRHDLMKKIAYRERCHGKSQDEIEAALKKWVEAQNPDFLTDSWDYIMKDAESLAAFYGKDSFKVKAKDPFITETDLDTLLGLRGMYKKKVLFLIMLFYRKYGSARITYDRIAAYTGASRSGVIKILSDLEEEGGRIAIKPGKKYFADGAARSTSNEYTFLPDISKPMGEKIYVRDWDFKPETFQQLYVDFMNEHVPDEKKKLCFTPKEMEELNMQKEDIYG